MSCFVDTSALYAVLDRDDDNHQRSATRWGALVTAREPLLTTNYCVVETAALVQHRLGVEAAATLFADVLPVLQIHWVGEEEHGAAASALLVARRRRLSLVDCTSFAVMRRLGLTRVFAFDRHFAEQGFATES